MDAETKLELLDAAAETPSEEDVIAVVENLKEECEELKAVVDLTLKTVEEKLRSMRPALTNQDLDMLLQEAEEVER